MAVTLGTIMRRVQKVRASYEKHESEVEQLKTNAIHCRDTTQDLLDNLTTADYNPAVLGRTGDVLTAFGGTADLATAWAAGVHDVITQTITVEETAERERGGITDAKESVGHMAHGAVYDE